jgi:RNA 2',3'-cyclic 3'-phosphodiesterase
MRLFIAVELPNDIRTQLTELQRVLRPLASAAKWVAPESIHITLKFLGEVPEKRVDQIDAALAGLAWKPFTIAVHSVGFFPGARSPRVFWAGMDAPTM